MRDALMDVLHCLAAATGPTGSLPPIGADSRLREDLGFDSVALVDLMVALETRLGVWFDPLDRRIITAFATVGSLDRYLSSLLGEGGEA